MIRTVKLVLGFRGHAVLPNACCRRSDRSLAARHPGRCGHFDRHRYVALEDVQSLIELKATVLVDDLTSDKTR